LRILLISEFFPLSNQGDFTGGVENNTFFLAKHLADKHTVTVICSATFDKSESFFPPGFRVIRVGPRRKHATGTDFTRLLYIADAIRVGCQIDTDIIQGTNFVNHAIAYQIGRIKKIPIIFWTPDVWRGEWFKNMGSFGGFIGEIIEKHNLSHRDVHFVAISNVVANKLIRATVPRELISVVPCGIECSRIDSVKKKKNTFPTISTVSRLVSYKAVDILIKSMPYILKEFPSAQLYIVGQGPEETKLRNLTQDMGIKEFVDFKGFKEKYDDVIGIIKSSHVFGFSSRIEGFGIALVEAMASGVPYVAVNSDVVGETTHGKGGMLFTQGDHKDCAKKIIYLLKNKEIYKKKENEGKRFVQRYDWKYVAGEMEKIYLEDTNFIKK